MVDAKSGTLGANWRIGALYVPCLLYHRTLLNS